VEQDDVFEATHALIFRLYTEGLIDGVRIDHVDGLADPGAYCRKLRSRLQALAMQRPAELPAGPAYIVVEKILAPDEQLRPNWEIDGTSGYDFMDRAGALLHDAEGEAPLTALWQELTECDHDFAAEVRQARRQLLANNLSGEFEAATRALHAVARTDLHTRDYSLGAIRRVFAELLVHFPVYRTYVDAEGGDAFDQEVMARTLTQARLSVERTEVPLLDTLAGWLSGNAPSESASAKARDLHQRAITRFQQLTPPLSAKSVEDTAFYRYGRLLSRNEVGSDPGQFSISPQEFHEANRVRAERFPYALLATATHDHKRGEDARARIAVLSEIPQAWSDTLREWMRLNAPLRTEIPGENEASACCAPQPADEIMLYQTLAGAWPMELQASDAQGMEEFTARIERWQTKALREAKQVSDWVLPNEPYEQACRKFLHAILEPRADNAFLRQLAEWVEKIAPASAAKSLSQTVLRLTSPGVPDLYQGTEFWDFSLVDPDNRRPVDFAAREHGLENMPLIQNADGWRQGQLKQNIIRRSLALRTEFPDLFSRGEYLPLEISGPLAGHAVAFARRHQERVIVVIAAHLPARLLGQSKTPSVPREAWKETAVMLENLAFSDWTDAYTGNAVRAKAGRILLAEALSKLPIALLQGF
jgi:(1->4)-alpha-D-glucan 1-alpha-D-glucosylmutase